MGLIKTNLQIDELKKILDELVAKEQKEFKFSIGKTAASGLAGFIAGIIVGIIITYSYFKSLEILNLSFLIK